MALPFPNGTFDIAVMALVIHFVPEAPQGVAEMSRVVRAGGTVATYVWDYSRGGSPLDPLDRVFEAAGVATVAPPSIGATSATSLRTLWEDAGLQEIEMTTITTHRTFVNYDELWASATGTGRYKSVVAEMKAEAVARIQAALRIRLPADGDGRITYASHANAIKGRVPV